jgi:hypothetical protein
VDHHAAADVHANMMDSGPRSGRPEEQEVAFDQLTHGHLGRGEVLLIGDAR